MGPDRVVCQGRILARRVLLEPGSRIWVGLLIWLLLPAACTTQYDEPVALMSFRVALSDGQEMTSGSPEAPLTYISGTSCGTGGCPNSEECIRYCAAAGSACSSDDDCPTRDYCAGICARPIYLDIAPVGTQGKEIQLLEDRWVHFQMVPGSIPPPYRNVLLKKGKGSQIKTYIAQAVRESHLWVEDLGTGIADGNYGACANGLDDDQDGLIDLADPDCEDRLDPKEAPASYATGLSPTLFFESPRIWNIQYTDQIASSPLAGQDITVDRGSLVITNVTGSGFFVTDVDDQQETTSEGAPGFFNSFFIYTFSTPVGVYYGDNLCAFSGGVVEYQGNTQMTFPSFEVYDPETGCRTRDDVDGSVKVPDPVDVTDLLVAEDPESKDYRDQLMANGAALEPFESSLIQLTDVKLSTRYLSCDADEDGEYPLNSDDDKCRDLCQADSMCTQLESFFKYAQLAAWVDLEAVVATPGAGKKIYVGLDMLKDKIPLKIPYIGSNDESGNCPSIMDDEGNVLVANPHRVVVGDTLYWEYSCPDLSLDSLTGNLRHIYLCTVNVGQKENCGLQMQMVLPRFDEDVVFHTEESP